MHVGDVSVNEVQLAYDESGTIQRITIYVRMNEGLRIGDVASLFGEPSEIMFYPNPRLFYEGETIYTNISAFPFGSTGWQAPVDQISFSAL